jgi:hypothetical protein
MHLAQTRLLALGLLAPFPVIAIACSGSSASSGATSSFDASADVGSAKPDAGGSLVDSGAPETGLPVPDAPSGQLETVSFSYTPGWTGVVSVAVLGGFGQSEDWMSPLVTLTANDQGQYTGTAQLPAGTYPYIYEVTGDSAASKPSKYMRYVVDPADPTVVPCPTTSPTYDPNNPNPCSSLAVPQPAPAALFHLTGTVTYDGAPIGGYLVVLERHDKSSHHFIANRTTSDMNAGTFDLVMATGTYDVEVLHPTYLSETDEQRDPFSLQALRRALSSPLPVAQGTTLQPAEVAYHDYDKLAPVGDAAVAVPTTFTYTVLPGATAAQIALYGPGKTIGDPWYTSPDSLATSAVFDGGFNTPKAMADAEAPGTPYWWGTMDQGASSDAGVVWTGESMVLPIVFE